MTDFLVYFSPSKWWIDSTDMKLNYKVMILCFFPLILCYAGCEIPPGRCRYPDTSHSQVNASHIYSEHSTNFMSVHTGCTEGKMEDPSSPYQRFDNWPKLKYQRLTVKTGWKMNLRRCCIFLRHRLRKTNEKKTWTIYDPFRENVAEVRNVNIVGEENIGIRVNFICFGFFVGKCFLHAF